MDEYTANSILGKPQYKTVHVADGAYRQLCLDNPKVQEQFNVQCWRPPANWKQQQRLNPARADEVSVNSDVIDGFDSDSYSDNECIDDSVVCTETFDYPTSLIGRLIGVKGQNLASFEVTKEQKGIMTVVNVTGPKYEVKNAVAYIIEIPKQYQADEESTQTDRTNAELRRKTPIVVHQEIAPWTPSSFRPTHFVCLPIADTNFRSQMRTFKQLVMKNSYEGIAEDLFQQPSRAHVTLCVLNLDSQARKNRAVKVFSSLQNQIYDAVKTRTVSLEFKKVDTMTDDDEATVVAAFPTTDNIRNDSIARINDMVGVIVHAFLEAELLSIEHVQRQRLMESDGKTLQIKLHATLLNSKFSRVNQLQPKGVAKLVKHFAFMSFGRVFFKEVNISSITGDNTSSGSYPLLTKCMLP